VCEETWFWLSRVTRCGDLELLFSEMGSSYVVPEGRWGDIVELCPLE